MAKETLKPGEKVEKSGQYEIRGPRGGRVDGGREVTLVKDGIAPPTPKPGQTLKLTDETKHKRK